MKNKLYPKFQGLCSVNLGQISSQRILCSVIIFINEFMDTCNNWMLNNDFNKLFRDYGRNLKILPFCDTIWLKCAKNFETLDHVSSCLTMVLSPFQTLKFSVKHLIRQIHESWWSRCPFSKGLSGMLIKIHN